MGAGMSSQQPVAGGGIMTGSDPNNPGNLQAQTLRQLGFSGPLPASAPTLNSQGVSASDVLKNIGKGVNAFQQTGGLNKALGTQQQGGMPVNFNIPSSPYIPPPQAMSNPFYGY